MATLIFVASIAAFNDSGQLLFGKRADNNKWCMPGGKFEESEYPTQAAMRELYEETGLVPVDGLEFIGEARVRNGKVHVFSFKATVNMEPDNGLDPDEEFSEFQWVEPDNIPEEILNNLYNKEDVTLQKLGLQTKTLKSEGSYWRSVDMKIPHFTNPTRLIWNESYLGKVKEVFAKAEETVQEFLVDVTKIRGANQPGNKERIKLYKRMLAGGDRLPPVVLRYDGHGLTLVDGNHRQEACLQLGVKYTNAIVVIDDNQIAKGAGMAALMGAMLMGGAMNGPKPVMPTVHTIADGAGMKVWSPDGLDKDLYPIAQLESSMGQNLNHGKNPAGEYQTAYGALGYKPISAHDEYKQSPGIQKVYPGLNDPADFLKTFKQDPKFYNALANSYFKKLKARHGSAEEGARAWRYGTTAVYNKDPNAIADTEGYVAKYKELAGKK